MAKTDAEIKERKEKKKEDKKKRKHSEVDEDAAAAVKKEKKDKKRKSSAVDDDTTIADASLVLKNGDEGDITMTDAADIPLAALVPFANPLCDDKAQKKVLKTVKKAAKNKALKRGVKECVKAIRKSPSSGPASSGNINTLPTGIVILAADISPIDVISHIPVLCEDHNIPYVYVPSRAELGAAGSTKRPTSVVMMTPKVGGKKKDGEGGDAGEWEESYKDLHKLALKLGQQVKV